MAELPTKEQLDELEALSKAASGNLRACPCGNCGLVWVDGAGDATAQAYHCVCENPSTGEHQGAANALYIAKLQPEVVLSLIAAARELESLKSALVFLCSKDASVEVFERDGSASLCCTEPVPMMEMARSLGWLPSAPEQKEGPRG